MRKGIPLQEVVIFVGLQGAGKSTFYEQRFAETHVRISKDLMPNNRNKERRQLQLLRETLAAGQPVVVDNTNAAPAERQALIEIAREHGARVVGYFFACETKDCVVRNRQRTGRAKVPDVAIYVTASKLRRPELGEGFDEIYEVTTPAGGGFTVKKQQG